MNALKHTLCCLLLAAAAHAQTATDTGTGTTTAGASGTVNYARMVGQDANAFGTPEANLMSVLDNNVDLTPDPTCANVGTEGEMTILDTNEGAPIYRQVCEGTAKGQLLSKIPGARVTASADQTVTADKHVEFNTEVYDTDAFHDVTATNASGSVCGTLVDNTCLQVPPGFDGLYIIGCQIRWEIEATNSGSRWVNMQLNATTNIASHIINPGNGEPAVNNPTTTYHLVAGDYVTCKANETFTGDTDVVVDGSYSPVLWMYRIGSTN